MLSLKEAVNKYSGYILSVWWVFSFIITHMTIPEGAQGPPHIDKIVHILIYTALAFLLSLWLRKRHQVKQKQVILIFLILLTYSVLDEFLQGFTGRTPDMRDISANIVGVIIGLVAFLKWGKFSD